MERELKIKVCGMRNQENIAALSDLGADYVGFIFYNKSSRSAIDLDINVESNDLIRTGVFVNEAVDFVQKKIKDYKLNAIQLHGDESPRYCKALIQKGLSIIKVFSIGESFDFESTIAYEEFCDYFLFDTKGKERGGNGVVFNWSLLENYNGSLPFFLSGGISPESIDAIKAFQHEKLFGLDLNSKFEIQPGLKNIDQLKTFIDGIRS
jgi:phosphoribosylanthranilate isomerase